MGFTLADTAPDGVVKCRDTEPYVPVSVSYMTFINWFQTHLDASKTNENVFIDLPY